MMIGVILPGSESLHMLRILLDTLWSCAIHNAKFECDISLYLLYNEYLHDHRRNIGWV